MSDLSQKDWSYFNNESMVDFLQSYPLGPNVLSCDWVLSSSFEDTAEQLLKDLEKGTHIFEDHEVYFLVENYIKRKGHYPPTTFI